MQLSNKMNELIQQLLPEIVKIRQQLHQIPELKFEEFKTAALIANTLTSYGIPADTGIAKTGIVATIDSGKPGKTIACATWMPCLSMNKHSLPASQHINKMYVRGQDGHTATFIIDCILITTMNIFLKRNCFQSRRRWFSCHDCSRCFK